MLLVGEENATTTHELMRLAGITDSRDLRLRIEAERAAGALILSTCAGHGGYFLPLDRGEIERYVGTLRRRALSTLRTLRPAKRALRELDGQYRIGGFE